MYELKGKLNKMGIDENGAIYIQVIGEQDHHVKWKNKSYNVFMDCNDDKELNPKHNIILKEDEKLFIQDSKFEKLLFTALDKGKMISIGIEEEKISGKNNQDSMETQEVIKNNENSVENEEVKDDMECNVEYIVKKVEISK